MTRFQQSEKMDLGQEINVIHAATYPATYPLHWHKEIEMNYCGKGTGSRLHPEIEVQEKRYSLDEGDILLMWQGELHSTVQNEARMITGFQFDPSAFQEMKDFDPYRTRLRRIHKIEKRLHPGIAEELGELLMEIIRLQEKKPAFYRVEKSICLLEFLTALAKNADRLLDGEAVQDRELDEETVSKVYAACSYIGEHIDQDISLADAAGVAGFTPNYFSRIFREVMGITFVEYLMHERVKKAQTYLGDSSYSVTEAAFLSGFKSISSFNRIFHRIKNCSPSEFRRYMD